MSSQLREMREKQARLVAEARAKWDDVKDDTPAERAAEIEREFDAIMAEHERLGERIAREERLARATSALQDVDARRRPNRGDAAADAGTDEGPSYREAFAQYIIAGGAMGDLDGEMRHVLRRGLVHLGGEKRAQTVGTDSAGGYTVPEELANILTRSMKAWGPMYDEDVCTVLTTGTGATIRMPTVDDTGVAAVAHTEGGALTDDGGADVTFGEKLLEAYAFNTEWVRVSTELMTDSIFNMELLLGDLLGERLGRIANARLTTGTGSGQPNGIATAATIGHTAASTTAITWDEVLDLEHSVDPAYRTGPKVGYMFNDATLKALRKLKDGDGNYLWQAGNVQAGVPATFNGRRYWINQDMASLGTGNRVMLFGDFGKYYVRKVGAPIIGAVRERFWPDVGIAGYIRFDGELADAAAVKALRNATS